MEGKSYEGSRVMARRAALVGLVALVTAGFGGCGDSAEPSGPTVTQRITRDFGHELLASEQSAPLAGHGTVLRLLREYEEVKTSAGGSAVSSIDGLKADWERKSENDDESTWALIVNGIEADEEPGKYKLYPGDVIFTGSPPGVSEVHPGDVMHCACALIGEMDVRVRAAE